MIKSAQDVLAVAKARGFGVRINPGPPPMPVLVVNGRTEKEVEVLKSLANEPLMEALRAWRPEILEELQSQ